MNKKLYSIGIVNLALLNPPIGLARYTRKVINILSKDTDVTAYSFDGDSKNELKDIKIVSVLNAKKYGFFPLRVLMYTYAIFKLMFCIKKHDVLISSGVFESYMIFYNKLFVNPKVKTIVETHHIPGGLTFKELKKRGFANGCLTLFGNFLMTRFDAVITVSEFWKNKIHQFYKIPTEKIFIAYCGVEDILNKKKETYKLDLKHPIMYAGITSPEHNLELVVKSLPIIKKKFKDANLVLTGRKDEKYFNKLMNLAKSLNVEDSIHHLGILPEKNLPDIYKQSDLVVYVPTEEIGWSAVLLKGILYKKPSIAINRGALKEFVKRYDGIIVSNNTTSFSNAVIKLLENKKLRDKIIRNAYDRAKRDTWDNTAKIHLQCIEDLMKN